MNLGFLEGSGRGVFYSAEKQGEPSIGDQRPPVHRATFSPGGERNSRLGPGCGLGAEEASRASARAGRGLYWAAGNQLGQERWRARVKQAMGRISLGRR